MEHILQEAVSPGRKPKHTRTWYIDSQVDDSQRRDLQWRNLRQLLPEALLQVLRTPLKKEIETAKWPSSFWGQWAKHWHHLPIDKYEEVFDQVFETHSQGHFALQAMGHRLQPADSQM